MATGMRADLPKLLEVTNNLQQVLPRPQAGEIRGRKVFPLQTKDTITRDLPILEQQILLIGKSLSTNSSEDELRAVTVAVDVLGKLRTNFKLKEVTGNPNLLRKFLGWLSGVFRQTLHVRVGQESVGDDINKRVSDLMVGRKKLKEAEGKQLPVPASGKWRQLIQSRAKAKEAKKARQEEINKKNAEIKESDRSNKSFEELLKRTESLPAHVVQKVKELAKTWENPLFWIEKEASGQMVLHTLGRGIEKTVPIKNESVDFGEGPIANVATLKTQKTSYIALEDVVRWYATLLPLIGQPVEDESELKDLQPVIPEGKLLATAWQDEKGLHLVTVREEDIDRFVVDFQTSSGQMLLQREGLESEEVSSSTDEVSLSGEENSESFVRIEKEDLSLGGIATKLSDLLLESFDDIIAFQDESLKKVGQQMMAFRDIGLPKAAGEYGVVSLKEGRVVLESGKGYVTVDLWENPGKLTANGVVYENLNELSKALMPGMVPAKKTKGS